MYIPHACIILTMASYVESRAAPSVASQNQETSRRALPQSGDNLALPVMSTNSSLTISNTPGEIECYKQEPGRPFVTYDSCLLLFTRVSNHHIFRKQQEYSPSHARTPWIWRSGRDCEIQVWAGRVSEAADQYIMAMAAWYVISSFSNWYIPMIFHAEMLSW